MIYTLGYSSLAVYDFYCVTCWSLGRVRKNFELCGWSTAKIYLNMLVGSSILAWATLMLDEQFFRMKWTTLSAKANLNFRISYSLTETSHLIGRGWLMFKLQRGWRSWVHNLMNWSFEQEHIFNSRYTSTKRFSPSKLTYYRQVRLSLWALTSMSG